MATASKNIIKKPVDMVIGFVMDAVSKWRQENTEKVIYDKVTGLLNSKTEEMTLKLLGFDLSWGEWKLDHCNGRQGNSAAGDYLRNIQSTAIKEFFDSLAIKSIITPAMKTRLAKIAQKEFEYRLEEKVRAGVSAYTQKYVDKLILDMTQSDDIENVIKTIKLLDAN